MSGVLDLLFHAQERTAAVLQSRQKEQVAPFLRGDSCAAVRRHGFIPLAIADDMNFSLSTAVEREALRRHFLNDTRSGGATNSGADSSSGGGGFEEVYTLQLAYRTASASNGPAEQATADAARRACMEALRTAVDAAVATEREAVLAAVRGHTDAASEAPAQLRPSGKRQRSSPAGTQRLRGSSGLGLPTAASLQCAPPALRSASPSEAPRRFLVAVRCASVAAAFAVHSSGGSGRGAGGAAARDAGGSGDLLYLLLADIVAIHQRMQGQLAALRRRFARPSGIRAVQLAVLLLPEDIGDGTFGSTKLAQWIQPAFGREYLVRPFCEAEVEGEGEGEGHYGSAAVARVLQLWDPVAVPPAEAKGGAGTPAARLDHRLVLAEPRFFLARSSQLRLAWFLWHSLRYVPVLLSPLWFHRLKRVWAAQRQLQDVVYCLHTLLMPFEFAAEKNSTRRAAGAGPGAVPSVMLLLDALYASAAVMATRSGAGPQSEAVLFVLAYEDLIEQRGHRLLRLPAVVDALLSVRRLEHGGNHCAPSAATRLAQAEAALQEDVPALLLGASLTPAGADLVLRAAQLGAAAPPVAAALRRSALLAALPPLPSLAQLRQAVRYPTIHAAPAHAAVMPAAWEGEELRGRRRATTGLPLLLPHTAPAAALVSRNNFFSPFLPQDVRVLHVLTAAGVAAARASRRRTPAGGDSKMTGPPWVPLAQVQWAAQLSDVELIEELEMLRRSGLVVLRTQDLVARSTLLPEMEEE